MSETQEELDDLKERVEILEQDVSLKQFCQGLALLGHSLAIRFEKTADAHLIDISKVTEDTKGENNA
jgi:hypothetical protein